MTQEQREVWLDWISNKRKHTCSCGHVEWAHFQNGRCAHCKCEQCDAEPNPLSQFHYKDPHLCT